MTIAEGGFAQAKQCSCVTSCPVCLGSNLVVVAGESKICFDPAPRSVVAKINNATIPSRFSEATLAGFTNFSGNLRGKVAYLQEWVRGFDPRRGRGLLLSGPVGIGKTYLLVAMANELIKRKINVRFTDFFQLLSVLRDGFTHARSELSVLEPLISVDVLIIDEMGKGRNSNWEQRVLDQLIMGRYNRNRTIVASTNYRLSEPRTSNRQQFNVPLDEGGLSGSESEFQVKELQVLVGERTYSRLVEMTEFVELEGRDFRQQRGKE